MSQNAITVRRMAFEYPERVEPDFIPGAAEESLLFIGLSLLLPYLEPYLIRSMNQAKKIITDPALVDDLARFNAQEGQHYKEHARFNDRVRGRDNPALLGLEAELKADYERFTAERPLRFNLAYAEGFEAMTAATAVMLMEEVGQRGIPNEIEALMAWHAIEELEHRTVAFDVYEHVHGRWLYRLGVGMFAQLHLLRFVYRSALAIIAADPGWEERNRAGRWGRMWAFWKKATFRLLPKVVLTWMPWYDPRRIAFTAQMKGLADGYTAIAKSTS